jgi:hypothetical protein
MANVYATQELKGGGTKGSVNWIQLTMVKLKVSLKY